MLKNKPLFILAPMDEVTDTCFRQIVASCYKPDICFSEFVNVDGLNSPGRSRLMYKLYKSEQETNLIAHIWGLNPDNFYKTASQIVNGDIQHELPGSGNYSGIDLNMGCPARKVVKSGACSGLINNPNLAVEIIKATKKGSQNKLPISVKTRLGMDQISQDWISLLLKQNLDMLSIHLRTVKEMSNVPAHYPELKWIVDLRNKLSPKTKIIANGDIDSYVLAKELIDKYSIDGVMIGRGVFNDPYVFDPNSPWLNKSSLEKVKLFIRHLELYKDWLELSHAHTVTRMHKFAKVYITGFDQAKSIREELTKDSTILDMIATCKKCLKTI